jgi:exonuclease SbcD
VPFLRPGDVPRVENSENPYAAGVAELYRQALDRALARRAPGQAIVALGHCHMTGASSSVDSERRIVIGGSEALPSTLFGPEIAYAALGHLHLAQAVGKAECVRYSGSPLPMSFSETHYRHQVLCIDLDGETAAEVVPLFIPRKVDMLRIPPRHAPLEEALALLADLPEAHAAPAPYLEVRIALEQPEPGLRTRIEAVLSGRHARLARIDTVLPRRRQTESEAVPEQLAQLQPDDIFRRLYRQRFDDEVPADQMAAFAELMLVAAGAAR